MGKGESLAELLESKLDPQWVAKVTKKIDDGLVDATIGRDQREYLACVVDDTRHPRLWKEDQARLPEKLRRERLYDHHIEGYLTDALCGLSEDARSKLMEAILPLHACDMRRAWSILNRRPVAGGDRGTSRFRAPSRTPLLDRTRAEWFTRILTKVGPVTCSIQEYAALIGGVTDWQGDLPWLFAGAIEAGGPEGNAVLETMLEQIQSGAEAGEGIGSAIATLLTCANPVAHEAVERLLLAAQRQEGLRQAILEAVPSAHPEAFRRMCRVILEHRLCRFSSVVRAADVWFGLLWDSASPGVVENSIRSVLRYLENPADRTSAVHGKDAEQAYFALWAAAFDNIDDAIALGADALKSDRAETRWAATHLLSQIGTGDCDLLVTGSLEDPDLRVVARAMPTVERLDYPDKLVTDSDRRLLVKRLVALLQRLPNRKTAYKAAVWPWTKGELDRSKAAGALVSIAPVDLLADLSEHVAAMSSSDKSTLASRLCGFESLQRYDSEWPPKAAAKSLSKRERAIVINLYHDASADTVRVAIQAMFGQPLESDEEQTLREVLKRKSPEVRAAALGRLSSLPDDRLLRCSQELLDDKDANRRLAGLEVLRTMIGAKRLVETARRQAVAWASTRKSLAAGEARGLEVINSESIELPKRSDAFGLLDRSLLPKPAAARSRPCLEMSDAAWRCLAEVTLLVARNKDREIPVDSKSYSQEPQLLGSGTGLWRASRPNPDATIESEIARCPIGDLLTPWLAARPPESIDPDGMELVRAAIATSRFRAQTGRPHWTFRLDWPAAWKKWLESRSPDALMVTVDSIEYVLNWLLRLFAPVGIAEKMMDSIEGAIFDGRFQPLCDDLDEDDEPRPAGLSPRDFGLSAAGWHEQLERLTEILPLNADEAFGPRLWALARSARAGAQAFFDGLSVAERTESYLRHASICGVNIGDARITHLAAAGVLSVAEILDYATHPYWSDERGNVDWLTRSSLLEDAMDLEDASSQVRQWKHTERAAREHPAVVSAASKLRDRLIDLEVSRGDTATEATPMAMDVEFSGGADACLRCVAALGTTAFKRMGRWGDQSRQASLTHLISVSHPLPTDTPETFAALAQKHKVSEESLVALAVFAPQWARFAAAAVGRSWSGLEDAVWWIHAHTKDSEYRVDSNLRERWEAAISERTPLNADERRDGAVDVDWFTRMHAAIGAKGWKQLDEYAKFASGNAGHKRAQLFAEAMLGTAKEKELMSRVRTKRHQDSMRALGLVPLSSGSKRQEQVLVRYKLLQEIRRTSRKHGGSMLQASEKRAVEIGLENLARSAGYADPLRLQWAMERMDLKDLADGPVEVRKGDVKVTLRVTDDGTPELEAQRNGKVLASIPPAVKKNAAVAELAQRNTELRRTGSRVRLSLEQAMCRGDIFTAAELGQLFEHPVLRPMIERLVFVGAENPKLAGYPSKKGKLLLDHSGASEVLKGTDALRLAHPLDFLKRRDWTKWQRDCFQSERVQPFKQIFRELYVPTVSERDRATECKRYEGHQVQPRQAIALLGTRQWINRPDEGVQKTFYKERVTARLQFAESFYTPAEVEGLTLESLVFTVSGDYKPLELAKVPARVFSEALRDLDLVVSVAHRGGVDPEASQSTVEMRAALVLETAKLLRLANVIVEGSRVKIRGTLAEYAVHINSASVQVMPGGQLWIVPVHAQHRGRLFLPFAANDPKTAEVLTKVLTLARDSEIQDPSILQQIARWTG